MHIHWENTEMNQKQNIYLFNPNILIVIYLTVCCSFLLQLRELSVDPFNDPRVTWFSTGKAQILDYPAIIVYPPKRNFQPYLGRHLLTGSDNLKNCVASKDKNKPFMVLWSKQASISCYVKTFGKVLNFVTGMTNGPNPWAQVKAPMSSCKHLSFILVNYLLTAGLTLNGEIKFYSYKLSKIIKYGTKTRINFKEG